MTTFVKVTLDVPVDDAGRLLLPGNLTVGGNPDLTGTAISALPKNLKVFAGLDLVGFFGIKPNFHAKIAPLFDGNQEKVQI